MKRKKFNYTDVVTNSFIVVALILMSTSAFAQTTTPTPGAADSTSSSTLSATAKVGTSTDTGATADTAVGTTAVDTTNPATDTTTAETTEPTQPAEPTKEPSSEEDEEVENVTLNVNDSTDGEIEPASSEQMGYKKGFFLQDKEGKFKLKINSRMQTRYTFESNELHVDYTDETYRETEHHFSIPAARLKLSGHLYSKNITYAFQADFGKGDVILKDVYADFAFIPKVLHLRAGQWVKPFSRQHITSSGKLELTSRALTDKAYRAGRDIGVAVHNNYEKSPTIEWVVGAFNGTGSKPQFSGEVELPEDSDDPADAVITGQSSNYPSKFNPMVVARVGYNYGDLKGYSEADLEGGGLRFGVAGGGIMDFDVDDDDNSNIRGGLDFILKVHGFSLSGAAYVEMAQDGAGFADQKYDSLGFHAQTGYVIKQLIQPAARFSMLMPEGEKDNVMEMIGGVSIFVFKNHNLKWQTDGGAIMRQHVDGGVIDFVARTQLQLGF